MAFVRANIEEMAGYVPGAQPKEAGWVKLNQNENPYPVGRAVIQAMEEALRQIRGYPDSASQIVREKAAEVYQLPSSQIMASNGSDEMLRILLEACVGEGEEVVAFYPSYTYYKTLAAIQGARFRLVDYDEDYRLPVSTDLSRAKIVFLPNPNAPSGTLFSEGDISRLCSQVKSGLVVVDEAYADFARVSAIPLIHSHRNLFVTRTFSKSYSMAGLRVGLGFGSRDLVKQLDKVRDYYNLDVVAQAGAAAALGDQPSFRENLSKVIATRTRLMTGLDDLQVTYIPSHANFVLARFSDPSARQVYEALMARKILVRYFDSPRLDDCLRITVGTDEEIDIFLESLAAVLAQLRPHL